jgi:hypothetical protein
MKALVKYKSHSRAEKSDSIKFVDDATGQLPPIVTLQGGEKDGEQRAAKRMSFEKEPGRLIIVADSKVLYDGKGELQRTDAWQTTEEEGTQASASITFTIDRRFTGVELAAITDANALVLMFKPAQKALEFKKGEAKPQDDFVKKVGEELEKAFGPGEMVNGTLTFDAEAIKRRKKKDVA